MVQTKTKPEKTVKPLGERIFRKVYLKFRIQIKKAETEKLVWSHNVQKLCKGSSSDFMS